jgi:predicted ribosomally synthesized peptide with nif11-like leader
MTARNVIDFAQRLETDAALRSKVEAVAAADTGSALAAVARIAGEAGFAFTAKDLAAGFKQLGSGELGTADLDAVVGGAGGQQITSPSAFVNALAKVIPGAIPHGGFIDPCW